MDLIDTWRKREKREKKREKTRENKRKREKKMSRVNYYQSAFNSKKKRKTKCIGRNARNLKKWLLPLRIYIL